MTRSDYWETINYRDLPEWVKRVSKPKQPVNNTYTKIFYGKPYDYLVEYKVVRGKLYTNYWRSGHIPPPIVDPPPRPLGSPPRPPSVRLSSYHYLLIILVLAGLCFVVITQYNPLINVSSSEIPNQIITISQEMISSIKPKEPKTQDIEQYIFEITNTERQKNGLKSLTFDNNLASVARIHSQDMANNNYFSHTNLAGDGPAERAVKAGYATGKGYRIGLGENIGEMASGNVKDIGYVSKTPESIAQAQMKSWMDSPGHRRNIFDPSYDRIGVGVAYNGYVYIATQDFW